MAFVRYDRDFKIMMMMMIAEPIGDLSAYFGKYALQPV